MTTILHLASNESWIAAVEKGIYRADSLSAEGFIHCSTVSQIVDVADAFYLGQRGLVILVIDADKLTSELKWEPPAHPNPERAARVGNELFPHIYGPINVESVVKAVPFEPAENGTFSLPPELNS